jgi:hypothetical protein
LGTTPSRRWKLLNVRRPRLVPELDLDLLAD